MNGQEWLHSIVEILGVVVTILLFLWRSRQTDRHELEQRHKENQTKLDELISERKYLSPHDHVEKDGPLQAAGVIRRRNPSSNPGDGN